MTNFLLIFFIVILILTCVLITASILLQEDKSGGGVGMIGGSSQSFFGASSSSILSQITTVLLTIFFVLSLVIGIISSSFTQQSVITRDDIAKTQLEQYENEYRAKQALTSAPDSILIEDFEREISSVLSGSDKDFILTQYEKGDQYYSLKKGIEENDESKIVRILNSINFTLQSDTVRIETEE